MALITLKAPGPDGAVSHGGQDYPIRDGQVAVPEDAVDVLVERLGFARLDADEAQPAAPDAEVQPDPITLIGDPLDRPARRRKGAEDPDQPTSEPAPESDSPDLPQ